MLKLAGELEAQSKDLKRDGMYSCCANTYDYAAAEIRRAIKENLS